MKPQGFADRYLKPYKTKARTDGTSEIIPKKCPFCYGGQSNDKETFALNIEKGTYNCLRGKCGARGTFYQLLCKFGIVQKKGSYSKPTRRVKKPTSKLGDYMRSRGISKKTWKKRKIKQYKNTIVFPYYENNKEVMRKYRIIPQKKNGVYKKDKRMWRSKGGKPILWGIDNCTIDKPLVIVEGEIDALALDECGIENVVSVPSGTKDLLFLDINWEFLEQFDDIILWTDNDEPGYQLQQTLISRLGPWKCRKVETHYKDAGDLLTGKEEDKEGHKKEIQQLIKRSKEIEVKGILQLEEVEEFKLDETMRCETGIKILDEEIKGFFWGETTLWTGKNGNGKSTMVNQTAIEAINQDYPVFIFSGELSPGLVKYWLELQMAGIDNIDEQIDRIVVNPTALKQIRNWYKSKIYLYDLHQGNSATKLIEKIKYAIRRYGVRVVVVDSVMSAYLDFSEGEKKYEKEGVFVHKLVDIAKKFKIHMHIIAHPRKTDTLVTKEDIRGIGEIPDMADNIIRVRRFKSGEHDVELSVLKNRLFGKDTTVEFYYDEFSRRLYQISKSEKKYNWESDKEVPDFF